MLTNELMNKAKPVIDSTTIETPLGTMLACAVEQGICFLEFSDRRMLETEFKTLTKLFDAPILPGENRHFSLLRLQLNEYFEGGRKAFTLPLVMPGTAFQQQVWDALQKIPYGATLSYQEQANAVNNPKAVRAVALANGMNRIAIVVPCHRVIGSDGHLTGYGGGIWRKKWLLDLEQEHKQLKMEF